MSRTARCQPVGLHVLDNSSTGPGTAIYSTGTAFAGHCQLIFSGIGHQSVLSVPVVARRPAPAIEVAEVCSTLPRQADSAQRQAGPAFATGLVARRSPVRTDERADDGLGHGLPRPSFAHQFQSARRMGDYETDSVATPDQRKYALGSRETASLVLPR